MTQPDSDAATADNATAEADDAAIERRAYTDEGINPDDPALPEAIERTKRALAKLARQRGIDRVAELAADCGLQIDTPL